MRFLLVSLVLSTLGTLSTAWQTLGSAISSGQHNFTSFGSVVEISEDGSHVVVGAPSYDNGDGAVFLYELDPSIPEFILMHTMQGEGGEGLGKSLSLSPDGQMVAVRRAFNFSTVVQVFRIQPSTGTLQQVGSDIEGPASGTAVSLSRVLHQLSNLSTYFLLVSSEDYLGGRGMVQTFELNHQSSASEWVPFQSPLIGLTDGEKFGASAALVEAPSPLASSGRILRMAVSSPGFESGKGLVQVFTVDEDKGWSLLGDGIPGTQSGEYFGASVGMSATEQPYLVVGSPEKRLDGELNPRGVVQLFHWRSPAFGYTPSWQLVGTRLQGLTGRDKFGHAVAISRDGGRIAASSESHDGDRGYVSVYDRDTYDSLAIVEEPQYGSNPGDLFGSTVSLNAQGSVVVTSATQETLEGSIGVVHALIDDSPFCKNPIQTSDDATTLSHFLNRQVCRKGVSLVTERHECDNTKVYAGAKVLPCEWMPSTLELKEPTITPTTIFPTKSSHTPLPTSTPSPGPVGGGRTTEPTLPTTSTPTPVDSKENLSPTRTPTLSPSQFDSTHTPTVDSIGVDRTSSPTVPVREDPLEYVPPTASPTVISDSNTHTPASWAPTSRQTSADSSSRRSEACYCDGHNVCLNQSLPEGSALQVCVRLVGLQQEDLTVQDFQIEQRNLLLTSIEGGSVISKETSIHCSGNTCRIRTSVPSAFFGDDRATSLVVSGRIVASRNRNLRTAVQSRNDDEYLFRTVVALSRWHQDSPAVESDTPREGHKTRGLPPYLMWILPGMVVLVAAFLSSRFMRERQQKHNSSVLHDSSQYTN